MEVRSSAELTNLRTGAVLWSGEAAEMSSIDRRNMDAIVEAMTTAVQRSIQRLLTGMQEEVSSTPVSRR